MIEFEREEKIAIIRLNRPDVHNAINDDMMLRLEQVIEEINADPHLRCIILTATGEESFCAGGDLRYFATLNTPESCRDMSRRMQKILDQLYLGKKVVLAAINGQALGGGCEMITATHIRVAAEHATFAFRQAPNGIITGWGGGRRLLQQLSGSTALFMLLTGKTFSAKEAKEIGFIHQIVPRHQLFSLTYELANQIAEYNENAVTGFLELARLAPMTPRKTVQEWETDRFVELWFSREFQQILEKFRNDDRKNKDD
ncbi:MAG: enoyl-CoA hydratase/isomerase family protein [Calditrichaeota bacterium]|nr:MAG: enoyl-CoA hydratase/isomerase family protein [Calditrichota bacterium]